MGGNVFENVWPIEKDKVIPTIEAYIKELSLLFPKATDRLQKYVIVGSAGKKDISGDIDLAYDEKDIFSLEDFEINPNKFNIVLERLKGRARTSTIEMLRLKAFLICIGDIIQETSNRVGIESKKTGVGVLYTYYPIHPDNPFDYSKFVQIDWAVGNMDWLKFAYYSDIYEGNVKGLHRTQLIVSLFKAKEYTFSHVSGIKKNGIVVTETVDGAINLLKELYGREFTKETLSNYHTLHNYLLHSVSPELYSDILKIYFKILDSTRVDIPYDIQDFWIEHKDEFGMTGKFLPEESNLVKFL